MGCSTPSIAASTWPTMKTTISTASLSLPSGLPTTSNILSMPKLPAHRPPYKTLAICHPTPVPLSSLVHSDCRLVFEKNLDGTKKKKRERISKIIRKKNRKFTEEERKKKEEERALSSRPWVPDLLNDEPNLPHTNPPAPALEKKEKTRVTKELVTDYYPLSPTYVASNEEDTPNLIENLIPRPTPKEQRKVSQKKERMQKTEDTG